MSSTDSKSKSSKKTVLITGGSKGIGLGIALCLAAEGYRIILLARTKADLEDASRQVIAAGKKSGLTAEDVETAVMDMGDAEAITKQVPRLRLLQDGLFGLVNNAACEIVKPFNDFQRQEIDMIWQVNMLAPVLMIQTCRPFLKQVGGSVVNISSPADRGRSPGYSIYGASKAFLTSLTSHLATELGYEGIRINVVNPGSINTPLMEKIAAQFPSEEINREKARTPIGQRLGTPQEIGEAVHFCLTGPQFLHGADIRVDGGAY